MIENWQESWRARDEARNEYDLANRRSWLMAGTLVVATVVEYVLCTSITPNLPIAAAFAVPQAIAIIIVSMRVSRTWQRPGHGED